MKKKDYMSKELIKYLIFAASHVPQRACLTVKDLKYKWLAGSKSETVAKAKPIIAQFKGHQQDDQIPEMDMWYWNRK